MPRPTRIGRSPEFLALDAQRAERGDQNDCTVKALALACGVPYAVAHKAMEEQGRKIGRGAFEQQWIAAGRALGFSIQRLPISWHVMMTMEVKKQYGKNVASLTTFQPARFPNVWKGKPPLPLRSRGHISACVDGVVHDWANDRAKRVIDIYVVEPLS